MHANVVVGPGTSRLHKFACASPSGVTFGRTYGRFASADCQAHVQTLPNIDEHASVRALEFPLRRWTPIVVLRLNSANFPVFSRKTGKGETETSSQMTASTAS